MALNPSKSVAILFGTPQRLNSVSDLKCITVANTAIPLFDKVKIIGVTPDSNLTMGPHTKALSKSYFTTSALLDKSVHPWMMPQLLLLRLNLFHRAWIR